MDCKLISKRSSRIFLQGFIVLIGVAVLAFMLWEPHIEGRNVNATLFEIYFKDAFLAYAYVASIPFFVGLYQAFKVLGYIGQDDFLQRSVKSLRNIRYCAISIIGFALIGEFFIMLNESDDRAGGVVMGVMIILGSIVIFAIARVFERILTKAKR